MTQYKLVPVEPTEKQMEIGATHLEGCGFPANEKDAKDCYAAMVALAPAVNPWVSVEAWKGKDSRFYLCLHSDGYIGNTYFSMELNAFRNEECHSRIREVVYIWDESILPIPRPEK